ncbi:hypothetical protein [Nonomuraea jabiensis]|uniref:hypothetical protein n=1 Tax=Nonomuraea jabiensis TaxID=882448 RepID=UPI003D705B81
MKRSWIGENYPAISLLDGMMNAPGQGWARTVGLMGMSRRPLMPSMRLGRVPALLDAVVSIDGDLDLKTAL